MSRRRQSFRLFLSPSSSLSGLFTFDLAAHHIDDPLLPSLGGVNIKVENHGRVVQKKGNKLRTRFSSVFVRPNEPMGLPHFRLN